MNDDNGCDLEKNTLLANRYYYNNLLVCYTYLYIEAGRFFQLY